MDLGLLHKEIIRISKLVLDYKPDHRSISVDGFVINLIGFSKAHLTLAVCKETEVPEFGLEQATFMIFLGEAICPKILAVNESNYVMEYLQPAPPFLNSPRHQEVILNRLVWSRGFDDVPFTKIVGDESWRDELKSSI